MRRRTFIAALGGAAAWPIAARAQQPERMRRIGVLMPMAADDAEGQRRIAAFHQGLLQLGWTEGRNVRIDARWGARNNNGAAAYAGRPFRWKRLPKARCKASRCCSVMV
jgi:putative tryptophan/tyrosine transport system substrate-binding protein